MLLGAKEQTQLVCANFSSVPMSDGYWRDCLSVHPSLCLPHRTEEENYDHVQPHASECVKNDQLPTTCPFDRQCLQSLQFIQTLLFWNLLPLEAICITKANKPKCKCPYESAIDTILSHPTCPAITPPLRGITTYQASQV